MHFQIGERMAEKIRKAKVDDEVTRDIAEIDSDIIQLQILKELKEIRAATIYGTHKSNTFVEALAMILIGIGGLILMVFASTLSNNDYFGGLSDIFYALGLVIIGLALYVGRNTFQHKFK